MPKNKVKFNLKNVHYAPVTGEEGGELTYGPVDAIPGAVNLSLEAQGDIEPFYADGIIYYQSAANNGYQGDLEIALTPDKFREDILQEKLDEEDHVLTENVNAQFKNFALGFQIDGDVSETLFWFYNCSVSRPTTEASTNESSKTPQTDTLTISCAPAPNGDVRVKTTADTDTSTREGWFSSVYRAGASASVSGANLIKTMPKDVDFGLAENEKTVSDLIGDDVSIAWNGIEGKVTGSIRKISEAWTAFSKTGANTGHFFPLLLDSRYSGEDITVVGSTGEKTEKDLKWIIRLDDLMTKKNGILEFKVKGSTILRLDFSKANLLSV